MGCREHKVFIGDSRDMYVLSDATVDLVVTSPPYWNIKDYGSDDQIGYGQNLHSYLKDLFLVWKECVRVIKPGRRICINIGDQFARSSIYGRYKVIPLHAEIISQMERIGMDHMGSIIWTKKTTMNTSGGAVVMGSYPYPPNGIIEIDYEHILIFKKPGKSLKVEKEIKESSSLTKEEWKTFHSGHWNFGGARQVSHEAMFPLELPARLIRMFTFKGETVLDPFLGSGTTVKAADDHGRIGVGFEIRKDFLPLIMDRFGNGEHPDVEEIPSVGGIQHDIDYIPAITNADPPKAEKEKRELKRVRSIGSDLSIILDDGSEIEIGGLEITDSSGAREYLDRYVLGKEVSVEDQDDIDGSLLFLKNRIYINGELLKKKFAVILEGDFRARRRLEGILKRSKRDH